MNVPKVEWTSDQSLATGKGATLQTFVATMGPNRLEIKVAPGAKAI